MEDYSTLQVIARARTIAKLQAFLEEGEPEWRRAVIARLVENSLISPTAAELLFEANGLEFV